MSPRRVEVCVKCFHGFDAASNAWWGQKEAKLAAYWQQTLGAVDRVKTPGLEDHWQGPDGEYFVALEWIDLTPMSLQRWASSKANLELLCSFLDRLSEIPPPDWWSDAFSWPPNFRHLMSRFELLLQSPTGERSPFSDDLVANLGVDMDGRVVFLDYVHIFWPRRWLLNVFTAAELLHSTFGYLTRAGYSPIRMLMRNVPRSMIRSSMNLVAAAQKFRHRNRTADSRSRARAALGRRLLATAALAGWVGRAD